MLARKGYPPALALRVVREQLGDEAAELAALDDAAKLAGPTTSTPRSGSVAALAYRRLACKGWTGDSDTTSQARTG